jgi:hypothetical protein
MKAVIEFPNHILVKGIQAKTALAAEGKTDEEVQASLGETFKYEGDKLKYFVIALDVASQNMEKLSRVRVLILDEGQAVPPKATKVEEVHFVPDFVSPPGKPILEKVAFKGRGGKSNDEKRAKSSPWGPSPEEIAAKKDASLKAKAQKAKA